MTTQTTENHNHIRLTHGTTSKMIETSGTFFETMQLVSEYITHCVPVEDRNDISMKILARKKWDWVDEEFEASEVSQNNASVIAALVIDATEDYVN